MMEKDEVIELLNTIKAKKEIIQQYVNGLYSRNGTKMAYNLLFNVEGSNLINALCCLQQIHGLIISMHPESIYGTEYMQIKPKFETVYNKAMELSEYNARLIDVTLNVYQTIKADTPRFLANYEYCYQQLTSTIAGTNYSFVWLLLQIISNCEKLLSFLYMLLTGLADLKKGEVSVKLLKGRELGEMLGVKTPPE